MRRLREYQESPDAAGGQTLRYDGAERSLEVAAMCCFDAGNHLIGRLGLARADSYSEIGSVLRAAGIISEDTEQFMGELADLRNRLAHVYWRIRPAEVEQAIPRLIPQFERFTQEIQEFLESRD
jgi:uncharacterized protein YutE (UPF0331/DUF86 family)